MTTTAPSSATGALPVRRPSRPLPLVSGIAYSLSWLVGLFVFSSTTEVRSSGTQILRTYTGHQGTVVLQYVLTEGLPAVFLAVVTWSLARAISERATTSRRLVLAGGLVAAAVSLVQLALGLWLSVGLVSDRDAGAAGAIFRSINRLDGVKMLLIAVIALVATRAIRRRYVRLPNWLAYVAAALAVTITLSAIGYLALDNTFAMAAWVSLPCLLVFVTGTGIALSRRTAHRR
ncbi:MAG: hypothetical protein DLM62_04060 [Pseudonocardiales bacterium]|nr:MAG: hypothetical protein DLM62_04060 [Pseudonocardiales bacterium]